MPIPKRRFGKTELEMPVITGGGMRYQHSWADDAEARASITQENQQNLEACIRHALDLGINHIETARGYGTSEYQLGKILPQLPRDKMIVQTKVGPKESPAEFIETFETSIDLLGLDHVDLLAIHGVNNEEQFEHAKRCLPALQQLKKEGRCRHIGVTTHAPPDLAQEIINTGAFDYVNLHWYFVYHPLNWAPVEAAAARDMGVLIISPNDKGGKLYDPPQLLTDLCAPLHPMAFNTLYCLRRPEVHTLTMGAAKPSDYNLHAETVQGLPALSDEGVEGEQKFPMVGKIEAQLFQTLEKNLGTEWVHHWHEGLPRQVDTPGGLNIPEILRLWTFAKGLDMVEFGKMRYNLLGQADHWFPGETAAAVDDEALKPHLEKSPFANEIPDILRDAHKLLFDEPKQRLSES